MRSSFKFFLSTIFTFIFLNQIFAQSKPLYKLPENLPPKNSSANDEPFLLGTDNGLFRVFSNGLVQPLWSDGKVDRILKTSSAYYFITDKGILFSSDLLEFSECNNGLPFLTIKKYESQNGKKTAILEQKTPLLKDICADPSDPDILVTATKDAVYLTYDGGKNWKSIGSVSSKSAGIKAVAVAHMPTFARDGSQTGSELVVFMSHAIYGFSYYRPQAARPSWIEVSAGFSAMPSLTQVDEIADILPVLVKDKNGNVFTELYISQTFIPNFYKFDWKTKKAIKIYSGSEKSDTFDGLCQSKSNIIFSTLGKISYLSLIDGSVHDLESFDSWKSFLNSAHAILNCAYVPADFSKTETALTLNELWLLKPDFPFSPWLDKANDKKSIYVSAYQMRNMEGINKYKKIIKDNKLNSLVVDMKDDYGLLRFEPESQLLKQKGKVTQYKINLNQFVSEFKKEQIYLIARIVVFKDRNLANYDKKQYAVWDYKNNIPWVGVKEWETSYDEEGRLIEANPASYYDENWVDPYSEEVWEYNIEIAKELIERGFDEIQFDYIRFPTDGLNMGNISYRWRNKGMDKESALISFLSYARENINAPIGIDIYGANGWYRSGTRTGQDVELMSEYVDVICPMFYPSHFEQNFLEYAPVVERPYRIYFYGTYRNTVIGRNRIIVRPWVQAFYIGVRFDRLYYNKDYVRREIFGVRDGLDRGYMYWNNSGGFYDDISPDPEPEELSPWKENESDLQKRIPAFSSENSAKENSSYSKEELESEIERSKAMISILDTVLNQENEDSYNYSVHLLHIDPMVNFND